jgi:tetratricopeptide (TPR) repeat protein
MASRSVKFFLSSVSHELELYRDDIFQTLTGGDTVEVKEQKNFNNAGMSTLLKLDKYIANCDGVIHLIGNAVGSYPDKFNIEELLHKYPDLPTRLPYVENIATNGHTYSLTQWEAYLAIYHRRLLWIYQAGSDAKRGHDFVANDAEKDLQTKHQARLRKYKNHVNVFQSVDGLWRFLCKDLINNHFGHDLTPAAKQRLLISNLPTVGSLFKGRDEFLAQLRATLQDKPIAAVTAKHAIHGLGGVGKTRAAIEYGNLHEEHYNALLFITVDSPDKFESELANLCGVLKLAEKDAKEQKAQYEAALNWLQANPGWFLIIDNVDSPEAALKVETELAKLRGGHVVITSRIANWSKAVVALELDVITPEAAQELILEHTADKRAITPDDPAEALALAHDLGYLPLALEQAGAYIAENHCSLAAYRALWKKHDDEVLHWHNAQLMKYPRPVATTWQTSFDRVGPDGQHLLNILCWLAPDPIPVEMLEKISSVDGEVEINLKTARRNLAKYSLIKWVDAEHTSLRVHKLVQEITEYRLAVGVRLGWLKRGLRMVDEFCDGDPGDVRTWAPVYTPVRPHITAICAHSGRAKITELTARLMGNIATYLYTRAEYTEAEKLIKAALHIHQARFGHNHTDVAPLLNNMALLLKATNRLEEAEPLFRRALVIIEASCGENHSDVAPLLNNLATLLQATNRLEEAESLMRRGLAIGESSYGKDHPSVAIQLNNLADLLRATNRLIEAEPLFRRALAIDQASYGKTHPNVACNLSNLAMLLQSTNRLIEAEPLIRQALAIDQASFGPGHPMVAIRLNNLATLLQATNRFDEAEIQFARSVKILWQSLVPDHPNTQIATANYLGFLINHRHLSEAEAVTRIQAELAAVAPSEAERQ